MEKHDVARLETRIRELRDSLANLADDSDFEELIMIIHKPGFTSVAEQIFLSGIVDSMHAQTKSLLSLKRILKSGAGKIELNPQPLPP